MFNANFIIIGILCLGMLFLISFKFGSASPDKKKLDTEQIKISDPFFYDVALRKEFGSDGRPRITKWLPGQIIYYSVQGDGGQYTNLRQFREYVHEILGKLSSMTGLEYVEVQGSINANVNISFVKRISTSGTAGIVTEDSDHIMGLALAKLGSNGYLESGTVQVINSLSHEKTYGVTHEELSQCFTGIFNDTENPVHNNSIYYKFKTNENLIVGYTSEDIRVIKRLYSGEFD